MIGLCYSDVAKNSRMELFLTNSLNYVLYLHISRLSRQLLELNNAMLFPNGGKMTGKRKGSGGNTSRDPRGNLTAQDGYVEKFGAELKSCSGILHNDGTKVPVTSFRQAKKSQSLLQGRCDLCNRLYFATLQKPKFRILPILIYSENSGLFDWKASCPEVLVQPLQKALDHFKNSKCRNSNCPYDFQHGDLRKSMDVLTSSLKGVERLPKDANYLDDRSGLTFRVPKVIKALSEWAGKNGTLYNHVNTTEVWKWWVNSYSLDKAKSSDEENEQKLDSTFIAPWHELSDFSWGAGNLKDTDLNHTVPAFNKVKSSKTVLVGKTSIGNRAYGYLCEGDHRAMASLGNKCKKEKKSLGHTPAPLRWLGKNDPSNGVAEALSDNIRKRDSLDDLHAIAVTNPMEAGSYVSWQIRDKVISLGKNQVSKEQFTSHVQAEVEKYLDRLLESHKAGNHSSIYDDLKKADPGQTQIMYDYRYKKVVLFLESRPLNRKHSSK